MRARLMSIRILVLNDPPARQEITNRKQAELEQNRIAQDHRLLIDNANAPIFGIDVDGKVNEWNRKAAGIVGYTSDEVMGRDLVEDFITPEYKVSVEEVLDNALQGQETANFEFPLFTKDQRRVEVLLNATTRRDANGDITGVVGVGQGSFLIQNEHSINVEHPSPPLVCTSIYPEVSHAGTSDVDSNSCSQ